MDATKHQNCPNCGAHWEEEGQLGTGEWIYTCLECWDPDDPADLPWNWHAETGAVLRGHL